MNYQEELMKILHSIDIRKLFQWLYKKLPFEIRKKRFLGIIEDPRINHNWTTGTYRGKKVIIVTTNWHITNTLPYNLTTLNAFLHKPDKAKGTILIKDVDSDVWGRFTIPRGYTTALSITFPVNVNVAKNSKSILKAMIDIQDPTGLLHRVKRITIQPTLMHIVKKKDNFSIEDPSLIKDRTIKNVVSVLKNEVEQYKLRGRREGRLGSIDWPRGTLEYTQADGKRVYLFVSSNIQSVVSEYQRSVIDLYKKSSKADQIIIIKTLLIRLDKKTEYRDIAYFIFFCLFEMNQIQEALSAAKKNLMGDRAYGFSDMLRILDILLGFRYDEFTEANLEFIENYVYSTKEYSFNIKEKINAIRVKRF